MIFSGKWIRAGGFVPISDGSSFSGTQTSSLSINEVVADLEGNQLQLVISSNCFAPLISDVVTIETSPAPASLFTVDINDFTVDFTNLSENADSIIWHFGDGNSSMETSPQHTYQEQGMFTVELEVFNDCGSASDLQTILLGEVPIAGFSATPLIGCAPLEVTFQDESVGEVVTYQWALPGAVPDFPFEPSPTVVYNVPGMYDAGLIVSNLLGSDTLVSPQLIEVQGAPTASFTSTLNIFTIELNNESINANSYSWEFGDGATSNEINPTHTYQEPGTYTIELTATNGCGSTTFIESITIDAPLIAGFSGEQTIGCSPRQVQFMDESVGRNRQLYVELSGRHADHFQRR